MTATSSAPSGTAPADPAHAGAVTYTGTVVTRSPKDPAAFTQGLVTVDGTMFESTGLYGQSSLREVDPATGAVVRRVDLSPDVFGEGLAAVGDELLMITWKEHQAMVFDRASLTQVGSFTYDGEGWGLCTDPASGELVMSNGSPILTFRDPTTFEPLRTVDVTDAGRPVAELNELECITAEDGGLHVWANLWRSPEIVEIDATTGEVVGRLDAGAFLDLDALAGGDPDAVLNGIADAGESRLYLTGKRWPWLYLVELTPAISRSTERSTDQSTGKPVNGSTP